ncbi:hypothetical protein SVAN01_10317 [Stagonosporopsis vannaccii]|nr:hypothetical protein SVAN01_10317 [Stagonosporopsis vannaccii]
MAGQDQAVGAPAGPANDEKENSIEVKGCAGSRGRLTVHTPPEFETKRCGASGARCGGEGGRVLKDDALERSCGQTGFGRLAVWLCGKVTRRRAAVAPSTQRLDAPTAKRSVHKAGASPLSDSRFLALSLSIASAKTGRIPRASFDE